MASLTTPTNTTTGGTGAQQQNADEAISEAPAGEEDLGEDESAFDEEGILFGDSELINSIYTPAIIKHAIAVQSRGTNY